MPSGRPKEISFIPPSNGVVRVRATFDMTWRGPSTADAFATVFREQGGSTAYGSADVTPPKFTEQACRAEGTFSVTAGTLVKVGLFGFVGPIGGITFTNVKVEARFVPG